MTVTTTSVEQMARFRVERCLGRGGAGVVYEVLDRQRGGARLALKTLATRDALYIQGLKEEFRSLADIEHPNLLKLVELGCQDGLWFMLMELVDRGTPLTRYVREADGIDEPRIRASFAQLARGLRALHGAGKVHRDIKPSNVLVDVSGRVVILDFGLVRDVNPDRAEEMIVGTATYMAPEQALLEEVGPPADLYAFGVMLYESLTGRCPFDGDGSEVLAAKVGTPPKPPSSVARDVPPDLDALAVALLDMDPARRPGVREVIAVLEQGALGSDDRTSEKRRVAQFVGRASELAVLEQAFEDVRQGTPVTVLVEGEGGLGKSALARQFVRQRSGDVLTILGRCYESEAHPYKGVDSVMDAFAHHWLSRRGERALPVPIGAAQLARSFSAFAGVSGFAAENAEPPKDELRARMTLYAAARALFVTLARAQPLIVVIDDWHWADSDSVALLRDVLRPPNAPPFLLVVTVRPMAVEGDAAPTELPGDVRRVRLDRLSHEDSVHLAASMLGVQSSHPSASRVAAEAAGSPLFLDELARDREHATSEDAPVDLDSIIQRRVSHLTGPGRHLLETLCLAGVALPLPIAGRAAGLTAGELAVASAALRAGHLARGAVRNEVDLLEPYHDRIQQAVTASLSQDEARDRHLALADAMTDARWHDPEAIARHFLGAGDEARAIPPLLRAADRAQAAAAFALAARLYDRALSLSALPAADRPAIAERAALALSCAGFGREAARAYERAAELAPASALSHRRRAAEERMFAGDLDEGIAAAKRVLDAVNVGYPESTLATLVGLLWWRFLGALRSLRWRPRALSEKKRARLEEKLDACMGVAYATSIVDPVRGAYFQALSVLLTLRLGDPQRLPNALALSACFRAASGARNASAVQSLFTDALGWMAESGTIEARSFVEACHGVCDYLVGRFAEAAERCRAANALMVQDRPGSYWDQRNALTGRLWALAYLGRLAELGEESERLRREADARGDLAAGTARRIGNINLCWLRAGDPARARREAESALARWPQRGVHMTLFWGTYSLAQVDLYEGAPADALARLEERWGAFRRALVFEVEFSQVEARELRARARIAVAARLPASERGPLLAGARGDAAFMTATAGAYAKALAHSLEGAIAVLEGNPTRARESMRKALAGFELLSMLLHAAAMRRCLARLTDDDALEKLAQSYFAGEGVVDADAMTRLVAPAFDALGGAARALASKSA